MAKAQIRLYMQRTGRRDKELISQTVVQEDNQRVTNGWIRSIIFTHFKEFVISDRLILLSTSCTALRSCTPVAPDFWAWMYLEITPLKESVQAMWNQQLRETQEQQRKHMLEMTKPPERA